MDVMKERQPYFIYQRLTLAHPTEYFLEYVNQGFYYLLRDIYVSYPELDAAGATFGPELRFELKQKAQDIIPQDVPLPFRLCCTPGNDGIQATAANLLTAQPPKYNKMFNIIYPEKDNIEIKITGQNLTTPTVVDIMLNGYLIPADG